MAVLIVSGRDTRRQESCAVRAILANSVFTFCEFFRTPPFRGVTLGGRGAKSNPSTPLFYSLKMKCIGLESDMQSHFEKYGTLRERQESAFSPRKKSEILGKNPSKIGGGAHTPEVWNLSRCPCGASFGTGSAPLAPSGEEIFGVKVFAFPLNSPKTGGRRGEPMVP